MIMNTAIRAATPADLDILAVMNKHLIEDEQHDNPMTIPQLRGRMDEFMHGDYIAMLCEDENGNIVGYALINTTSTPTYLRQFFICRNERRKGYGRIFFAQILEYFNIDTIDIEVMVWNKAGRFFWESLHFKPRSLYMRYNSGDAHKDFQ